MKNCPACGSRYSDESLIYCLQDGTPLQENAKQSTVDTVAFATPATIEKLYKTDDIPAKRGPGTKQFQPYPQQPRAEPNRPRRTSTAIFGIAAAIFIFAGAGAAWFFLQGGNESTRNLEFAAAPNANVDAEAPVLEPPAADAALEPPTLAGDPKKMIGEILDAWVASANSKDLESYMSLYGEKVDHFDDAGASSSDVSRKVKTVFDSSDEIDVELSNLKIAADPNGNTATAVFDKDWTYESGSNVEDGKAHTRLHFEKIGDRWKIVSEKYIKVYYLDK